MQNRIVDMERAETFYSPIKAREVITHTVDILDFELKPNILKVQVGDRIKWTNRYLTPHTATAIDESGNRCTQKQSATILIEPNMAQDLSLIHISEPTRPY